MITFNGVSKRYGDVEALSDVTFEVSPGDVFGYIGPNGAGKTTSIKIMTGLVRGYTGSVTIGGTDISATGSETHRIIGYLPQEAGFQEWRTVEHTLGTFARLSGVPAGDIERKVGSVLSLFGLEDQRQRRIVHLSGGTVQKLRFAQAIVHDPKVIILDEPMSGLDPASRYQVKDIIRRLASEDRTIFFSSHILNDVEDIAGTIGILHHGTIRRVGSPKTLRDEFGLGNVLELEAADGAGISPGTFHTPVVRQTETAPGGRLRLTLDPAADLDGAIRTVLEICLSRGVRVRSFRHLKPSLEEVYMRLTGGGV